MALVYLFSFFIHELNTNIFCYCCLLRIFQPYIVRLGILKVECTTLLESTCSSICTS